MKKIVLLISAIAIALCCSINETTAQVMVKLKPVAPVIVKVKPAPRHPHWVWIDGHWKWNKKRNEYVWMDGYWVKPKRHHVWVPGHWKDVPGGFIWVDGHWRR